MTIEKPDPIAGVTPDQGNGALHLHSWARLARLVLHVWPERRRQRAQLRELEDHLLRDIGVTRGEALREARKPFWR
jgi:uncharacterized protein YjiS (DUF1127 family)